MKVPAIRGEVGIWCYYVSTLTFEQISNHVKKVDDELHSSKLLSDMLQRSITDNYINIASYISQQEERFFNALVLAVYDGDPQWHEVRLDYGNDDEFFNLGILELSGDEKIFPIDGQHRVEGIKRALTESPSLGNEKIPVIFIGHKKNKEGMQRSRRMFSTLNRYAKPVSMRDIIALDEDDSIAIVCRHLIENHPFFSDGCILDSKTKAISNTNQEFTTLITFYDCNRELLNLYIKDKTITSSVGKALRGAQKTKEYIRIRPIDEEINSFNNFCFNFWTDFYNTFDVLAEYSSVVLTKSDEKKIITNFRSSTGGNILFRPIALYALIKAAISISSKEHICLKSALITLNKIPMLLTDEMWKGVLWDSASNRMITSNKIIDLYLIYCTHPHLLNEKEKNKLIKEFQRILNTDNPTVALEYIDSFIVT